MKKRLLLSIPLLSIMFLSSCQNLLGGLNLALSSNENESDNNVSVESFDESLLDPTEEIIIPSERPSIDYSEELSETPSIPVIPSEPTDESSDSTYESTYIPTVEPSEPEQPSDPTIDNNQYYIDDINSWHFAGQNEYFDGGKWIANEWNATDYNQLQPVNLDTIYKMDYNLAEQLSTKDIKYLYAADVRFGVNDAFWTSKAIINDELYEQNGSYCIKVIKSYFNENDGCYNNVSWISDPLGAHLESLTPDTLFVPQWSEEKDKFGFCWYDNPVCIGEAGVYKLVIVEYNNEATPSTPNYGMALVLDYYVESPFKHTRYEQVEINSYGVIGSFADNNWESDYVDFNYYNDDFYSVSFDINAGVEFRIRENDEWTISYGSDNVINKADLSGYFDFSCGNFLSNVNANITINLFANTGEIYIYVNSLNPDIENNYNAALDIKNFLYDSYKDTYKYTSNFDMPISTITFDDNDNLVNVSINWEIQVSEGLNDVVYLGAIHDKNQEIVVNYDTNNTISTYFSLIGTIIDSNNNVEIVQFDLFVPAYTYTTFSEFAELANNKSNDIVHVKGVITAIYKSGIYISDDNNDGFYAYSPMDFNVSAYSLGDVVEVSGTPTIYNGQYEFNKNCVVKLINKNDNYEPIYNNLTNIFENATSASDTIFDNYVNSLVEINNVTIDSFDNSSSNTLYYYFTLNNVRTYIRPYIGWINPATNNYFTDEEINNMFSNWISGNNASIKGILSIYGGKYYLSVVNVDAVTYGSFSVELYERVQNALTFGSNALKDTYVMRNAFALPFEYNGVNLSYNFDSKVASIVSDQLVITPLSNDEYVKVNIKATCDGFNLVATKDILIKGYNYSSINVDEAYILASKLDADSKEISTEWYYVTATVGEIYNTKYCNFYLPTADNAQALTVYGLWTGEDSGENRYGSNREIAEIPVKTGDTVTLYTQLQNWKGTLELVNAMLINVIPCEKLTWSGSTSGIFSLMNDGTYEAIIPF